MYLREGSKSEVDFIDAKSSGAFLFAGGRRDSSSRADGKENFVSHQLNDLIGIEKEMRREKVTIHHFYDL